MAKSLPLFTKEQEVTSNSKYSFGKKGVVHKISEIGVHVKFIEKNIYGEKHIYEIFRYETSHALHSHISQLKH